MKTLYFDIDGTILCADEDELKPMLAGGKLETSIRNAGFGKLVCVGNYCTIAHVVKSVRPDYDEFGAILRLCRGAFVDEQWFRSVTSLIVDPALRTTHIDLSGDWWYVDDMAAEYFNSAHQGDVLSANLGGRVLIPDPTGDGQDILDWLNRVRA